MGLLDWLTDGIGSSMTTGGSGSAGPLVGATNSYSSPGSAPLSPDEMPPAPPPAPAAPPPVDPATSDIGGGMPPGGTGAAPPPPTPLPMARPPGAPGPVAAPAPAAPPPAAAPTRPPPTSFAPPPSPMPPPDSGPAAPPVQPYHLGDQTALGRSLGINPNSTSPSSNNFRSAMAGLGEGLTAAGNSKGKSAGQAFASGAGGALTGASKQDNTAYDQRLHSLQLAVTAQAAGDRAAYNKNYADYLKGKLANDAKEGGGKKSSAWNKPDSQKYLDAKRSVAQDQEVKSQAAMVKQAMADGNQNRVAAEQAKLTALIKQKEDKTFAVMNLSPATVQAMNGNPPGTPKNPHTVTSKADFDSYVKPGQAYKNPADGKIYIRKGEGHQDEPGGDQPASPKDTATQPTSPEPPGPAPRGTVEGDEGDEL